MNRLCEKAVPIMWVMMKRRTTEAYEKVFRFLKEKLPQKNIESVTTDFEAAMGIAAKRVYKNIILRKCYFHFTQVFI